MWTIDTSCCSTWGTLDAAAKTRATQYATYVMWALTGRRYGMCAVTIRPCGNGCRDYAGFYWDEGTYRPYIYNGNWYNSTCQCTSFCSCTARCRVYLPGPVAAISEVKVDGVLIPSSAYRVDDNGWLVREDGNCWPQVQDFNVSAGSVGSFTVTYFRGIPVPAVFQAAAGTLACEFALACAGQACRLPSRVTSLARQGVTFTAVDIADMVKLGFTGLPEVDMVIRAANPHGLPAPLRLYSPDLPTATMTTID